MKNYMPLLDTPLAIEMAILNQEQATKNHHQTLDHLASRGGLSPSEALAIVERRPWSNVDENHAIKILLWYGRNRHQLPKQG